MLKLARTWGSHLLRGKLRARLALHKAAADGGGLVPLAALLGMRRRFRAADPFEPHPYEYVRPGSRISDPILASWFADRSLGMWTMAPATLNLLLFLLDLRRPRTVFEFGSGVSTVCISHRLKQWAPPHQASVFSVEQGEEYALETRSMLGDRKLGECAAVKSVPLAALDWNGSEVMGYDPHALSVESFLGARAVDVVLVDGPSEHRGLTLGLLNGHLAPGAIILLDDALRDAELSVAEYWATLPRVEILGVFPVGKGMMVARAGDR